MKFSKLAAIMTAGVLAFNICAMSVSANEKITFGEMVAETNDGTTTVTVTADKVSAGQDVCLVAAYFDESGKILSIGSSVNSLATDGDTLTVSLTDKSAEGGELRYFLWDSLAGQIPLRNGAPASPENVVVTETTFSSASLSWDAAEDDYNSAQTYNIYDEGILLAEGVSTTEKTVDGLLWGTKYNFEVKAVDEEGAESAYGTTTPFFTESIMTSVTEGSKIENSSEFVFQGKMGNDYWLGTYIETSAAGLPCVANTTRVYSSTPTYLCFAYTPEKLAELSGVKDYVLELTYFDDNINYIMIEYKYLDAAGAEKQGKITGPQKTGTNTWKVARMNVTLAGSPTASTANHDGAYTFRFYENISGTTGNVIGSVDGYDIGLRVHRLSAMPKSEYSPKNAYFVAEKVNFACNMDAVDMQLLTSETVDDRRAIKTNRFEATVTDTIVTGGSNKYIEVNYYAPEEGTIISVGDDVREVVSDRWQKVVFNSDDVSDIVIEANKEIYIHSVRLVAE